VGKEIRKAVAYLRTSSRTNVGADKNSDKRQRAAIEAYAKPGVLRRGGERRGPGQRALTLGKRRANLMPS
jgi:hypothetical protein